MATTSETPNNYTTSSYTISFRGKTLPITNEALCIALLKLDTLKEQEYATKNEYLNELIQSYDDTLELLSSETEHKLLKQYLTYSKLAAQIQRNENLITDNIENTTHVYMLLLQDARSMLICLQEHDKHEDDLLLQAQAHIVRYRALYCYSLGQCYASFHYPYARGLLERALELASIAAEELSTVPNFQLLVQSMITLEKEITAAKCRLEANRFLQLTQNQKPLLQRLQDSTLQSKLVDLPPNKEYVPCKPSFFDLAWNYVEEFPNLEELEIYIKEQEKGTGLLGWFRRT